MTVGTSTEGAQKLSEAILTEAREQAQKILDQARLQTDSLIAQASTEANEILKKSHATAHAEAIRRTELINASIPVEAEQLHAHAVEQLLAGLYQEIRRHLLAHAGFNYGRALLALAVEPLRQMGGNSFVLRVAPVDYEKLSSTRAGTISRDKQSGSESSNGLAKSVSSPDADRFQTHGFVETILHQVGRPELAISLQADDTVQAGVIVQDKPGTQVWDNRLTARLERFWPELKRQVATQTGLVAAANFSETSR